MKDDHDKEFVLSLLRNYGFQVKPIAELTTHKTPDLRVITSQGDILIEVKAKDNDQQLRNLLESPKGTPLFYNVSSTETAIRDGWRQIREFPDRDDTNFTLIWFITRKVGGITVLTSSTAMGRLYGTEQLEGYTLDQKEFYQKECFFFHESIFFKYKELDGVVLHDDQSMKLCLNPFSSRYSSFKLSTFTNLFQTYFTIIDPEEKAAAGECFIAGCDIERKISMASFAN